jgi:Caudovirus prohead serine protease
MTAGYFFPYRPITQRLAPMIANPSWHAPPTRGSGLPTTYDADRREVDCIVATQSPTHCRFGMEVLRISESAVDLSLLDEGRLPLLDAHDSRRVLGRVTDCWIDNRKLYATLRFAKTPTGLYAAAMVERGELVGISLHASVQRWRDQDGNRTSNNTLNNPHFDTWRCDGGPQTFTATRWTLHEVSLTPCPRDHEAMVL